MNLSISALAIATIAGTLLQVAMVVAGHSNRAIAGLFAIGGMTFSLVAGIVYALLAKHGDVGPTVVGGLAAGALCALIGIGVSYLLKDVPASLLLLGTISSAVTGALGGYVGRLASRAFG